MFCWTVHLNGETKKSSRAAVAVAHRVYCFDGVRYWETHVNHIDVEVFNTVSLRWTKLTPAVTIGRGERRHLEATSMCNIHSAVLIEDIIYVWWGVTYTGGYRNVLYTLDVVTHRWFNPEVSGTLPESRWCHSACVLGKVIYIHGGYIHPTGLTNDVYKLDTATMVWSLIPPRGTPAPASSSHSATIIGTKMFVFGGQGHMRVFDTETNHWLSTPPPTQVLPAGRWSHSAFAYNGELYIFGGTNLNRRLNDLWKFNPETFSWKKVEPKRKGPCPIYNNMCCCMVGDCIVLFGGNTQGDSVYDVYILDLCPSLKTLCKLAVIQYGLEQSGVLPHNIGWELAAMTAKSHRKVPTASKATKGLFQLMLEMTLCL